jgi:phytoene dehydrogenase-like protein
VAATRDVIILGAGHNGLVAACYLAKAGFKPQVLERRPVVGGAAITGELHPGFKCPTLAHVGGPLADEIVRELQLEKHGLAMLHPDPRLFAPSPDGRSIVLYGDPARSASSIAGISQKDARQYPEFQRVLGEIGALLGRVMEMTPPSIDEPSKGDLWKLLMLGREFRGLGRKDMFRLLRWGPMAVADLAAEWFESEPLRAAVGARGIFGAFLGPWSAGSAALMLLRVAADAHPAGSSSVPRGGMGALTQALASAAKQAGARIRTGAEVAEIRVRNGEVSGVVLAGGEEIAAGAVISSADPRRTLLKLVDPVHLTPDFVVKLRNYRSTGVAAKVNLALSGPPNFAAAAAAAAGGDSCPVLSGRIQIGPEIDYLERAFDAAKYGQYSEHPYLDVTLPSIADPSLAPEGRHVMSVYMQYAPYKLRGAGWREQRDKLGDTVVRTLSAYAPGLENLILARQVITPLDLEETYGMTGGHIFHGELALDQLFTMRPLLNWARYATPVRGLYLCGSGTHPGNGLTGGSGRNAAREIAKALR